MYSRRRDQNSRARNSPLTLDLDDVLAALAAALLNLPLAHYLAPQAKRRQVPGRLQALFLPAGPDHLLGILADGDVVPRRALLPADLVPGEEGVEGDRRLLQVHAGYLRPAGQR